MIKIPKKIKNILLVIVVVFVILTIIDTCLSSSEPSVARMPPESIPFQINESVFNTNNSNINMIEINQSLSWGFDTDSGQFYIMENFVSGKETAIFVTFAQPINRDSSASLKIEHNGRVIAELQPFEILDNNRTMLFQPKNMADVNFWQQGAYRFIFEMDGSQAVRTTNFFDSMPMKVLAVPVIANYSGRIVRCNGEWRNGASMIISTFPLARADIDYVLGKELDLSDRRYDLDTDAGMERVWRALTDLQTRNKDYTIILGFVREPAGRGRILGYTYGLPTSIVVESEPDMLATVVHEIAHCYMIGDEYEGGHLNLVANSPPFRMQGIDIISNRSTRANKEAVQGGRSIGLSGTGSVIYREQRPYWVEGRRLLGAVTSYMGSGTGADSFTMWTTSDIWNHLFRIFTGVESKAGAGASATTTTSSAGHSTCNDCWGKCPDCTGNICAPNFYVFCPDCEQLLLLPGERRFRCTGCRTRLDFNDFTRENFIIECGLCNELNWLVVFDNFNSSPGFKSKEAEPVMVVEVTGFIDQNGVFEASPWYTYETDPGNVVIGRSGEYGIYFFDNAGNQISVTHFDLRQQSQIITREGPSFVQMDRIPVNVVARYPHNASRIVIKKGDVQIYSTNVSATAPEVAFTGLRDYQQLGDTVTLTWEASGQRDQLFFELWYCPSEDEFYNIASNITGRSYTVDLTSYPGTDEGYFYLYATDGVRTGEIDSSWVRVPFKAPEIFYEQTSIPQVKITEEIYFDPDVYDMQDGWLYGDDVVWMLNGREFMTGYMLWVWPYELPPGTHTFTCIATNSAGMSVSKNYTFRIIDDESDLPNDWSRTDIRNALSNGFVLPLNRIDAPVTRGQFASLMTTLYGTMSEDDDPYPEYIEGMVTDCGQDDYDQFLMVYLGVMEAQGGMFNPARTLPEREALLIMYRVCLLADPDFFNNLNESGIIEYFRNNNVTNSSGNNIYSAAERLTNRLALVRLSRLYNAVF